MIEEIIYSVKTFYLNCDKPTFFFALAIINQVVGFTPQIPSVGFYAIMILYALYQLYTMRHFNSALLLFLLYVPLNILVTHPAPVFKSWERYILFITLLISVSPLLIGRRTAILRMSIFKILIFSCAVLGVGSFICRFIGINYGTNELQTNLFAVGTFGGLCNHSMLLGPIAGVGVIYMTKLAYQTRKKMYYVFALMCLFAVMFSASRAALIGTISGLVVMLYKQSGSAGRFMKGAVAFTLIASLTFTLWGSALDDVIAKNDANIAGGGFTSSRTNKWMMRVEEFKNNPVLGVGFVAVDLRSAMAASDADMERGVVETGSSWLCILSMTGLIGALLLIPIFFSAFRTAWNKKTEMSPIILGILTMFYIHMIAEGYVLAGGSFLAFTVWLTVGLAYDQKSIRTFRMRKKDLKLLLSAKHNRPV